MGQISYHKSNFPFHYPKNKYELKTVAVDVWQSITKDETLHLLMSMRSRLQAVIDFKGFETVKV